jgi:hypothetical protein
MPVSAIAKHSVNLSQGQFDTVRKSVKCDKFTQAFRGHSG